MTGLPISPEVIQQVGGYVFGLCVCVAVILAFIVGKIVPGFVYDRERAGRDESTKLLGAMTGSVERLNGSVETLVKVVSARHGGGE